MNISIEVGHPAHVHYWRNVINQLKEKGHTINVFAREKEITIQMLQAYNLDFQIVGSSKSTMLWKVLDLPIEGFRVLRLAQRKRIEFMLSTGIPSSAHASRILGVPHISLIDTEIARLGRLLVEPFSDAICTPYCFKATVDPSKHIRFKGYLELMYLHPNYFSPNPSILHDIGLEEGDNFALVRFSSWDSSHDVGKKLGVLKSDNERLDMLNILSKRFKVFLTSEIPLPGEFDQYRLKISPEKFHDVLSYASVYVGDGAKTASEAGVLGVPWIYISKSKRGYLDDQESRFSLGKTVQSMEETERYIDEISQEDTIHEWSLKRKNLLNNTIDVTRFMTNLIDNWPESRDTFLTKA